MENNKKKVKLEKSDKIRILILIEVIVAVTIAIIIALLVGLKKKDTVDYPKLSNRILEVINQRISDDDLGDSVDTLVSVAYNKVDNTTYLTALNGIDEVYILKHENKENGKEKSFAELLEIDTTYFDETNAVKGVIEKQIIKLSQTDYDFTTKYADEIRSFKNIYNEEANTIHLEVEYLENKGFTLDLTPDSAYFDINKFILDNRE